LAIEDIGVKRLAITSRTQRISGDQPSDLKIRNNCQDNLRRIRISQSIHRIREGKCVPVEAKSDPQNFVIRHRHRVASTSAPIHPSRSQGVGDYSISHSIIDTYTKTMESAVSALIF
jgi:hypothetical protein